MPASILSGRSYWSSSSDSDEPEHAIMSSIKQRLAHRKQQVKHIMPSPSRTNSTARTPTTPEHRISNDSQRVLPYHHSRSRSSLSSVRSPTTPRTPRTPRSPGMSKAHALLGLDEMSVSPMSPDQTIQDPRCDSRRSMKPSPRSPRSPGSKAHALLGIAESTSPSGSTAHHSWMMNKALPDLPEIPSWTALPSPPPTVRNVSARHRVAMSSPLSDLDGLVSPRTMIPQAVPVKHDSVLGDIGSELEEEMYDPRVGVQERVVWKMPSYDSHPRMTAKKTAPPMRRQAISHVDELDFEDLGDWYESYGFDKTASKKEARMSADSATILM